MTTSPPTPFVYGGRSGRGGRDPGASPDQVSAGAPRPVIGPRVARERGLIKDEARLVKL
jgi:hypothetical protein